MSVDPSKLKSLSRRRLGEPPVDGNHQIEEPAAAPAAAPSPVAAPVMKRERVDGRTLRRTGRTIQFATKVSPSYDEQIRDVAADRGMLIVEVLEASLAAYLRLAAAGEAAGETPEQVLERLLSGKSTKRN